MLKRLLEKLAIRWIGKTMHREPDISHESTSVAGAVPYYREWNLFWLPFYRVSLTHLTSTDYKPLTGFKLVLLGWYRGILQEKPRHIVLREVAGFSWRPERVALPERGNCWLLRIHAR